VEKRGNLSSQAYKKFKELLFDKVWKPGDFVSQPELINKTGFSLSPMRDALHKLSAEGLVKITPRKGIQITPSSLKIIREVFHLRKIIEKEAVIFFINNAHEDVIKKLFERHKNLIGHIQFSASHDRAEPNDGEVNYPWLLNKFKELGYSGFFGAEYFPRNTTSDHPTEKGIKWLKQFKL